MLEKTEGIILKTIPYGDSSSIVKVFTEKYGIVAVIIKGIRSTKNKERTIFQPSFCIQFSIYYRTNKSLFHIKEYQLAHVYKQIPQHIPKLSVALFVVELVASTLKEHQEQAELYSATKQFIIDIDASTVIKDYPLQYCYLLARYLGCLPLLQDHRMFPYFNLQKGCFEATQNFDCLDVQQSILFARMLNIQQTAILSFSYSERIALINIWQQYFKYHVPEFKALRTPLVLQEVLH